MMTQARDLARQTMGEIVQITHIPLHEDLEKEELTFEKYREQYGHLANVIGAMSPSGEEEYRTLLLPHPFLATNDEGETWTMPFEYNMLVYVAFDPARHHFEDINETATRMLSVAGSGDQAVWDAAVVSSSVRDLGLNQIGIANQ
jgi:hypothetical protein